MSNLKSIVMALANNVPYSYVMRLQLFEQGKTEFDLMFLILNMKEMHTIP